MTTTQNTQNQPPLQQQYDPDMRALFAAFKLEIGKNINCVRIGVIQSFDASDQTATVQLAQQYIQNIAPDGTRTIGTFSPLLKVPVHFPSGGGYTLTFPIAGGDECIVLFNDREIDNWFQQGGTNSSPTSARLHDMADGLALVGIRSHPRSLGGVSTNSTQLRSDDGAISIDLNSGSGIATITAATQINLNSPTVVVQGAISVVNSHSVVTPCAITGAVTATGEITSTLGGTHTLTQHKHGGVQSGASQTATPTG